MKRSLIIFSLIFMIGSFCHSEEADTTTRIGVFKPYKIFENSAELNKPRVYTISGSILGMYAASNIWWQRAWYAQYPKSKFHFFNDAGEWMQMDKGGHIYSAYFLSRWGSNMYKWAGVNDNAAAWIGFAGANFWQLSVELHDAFSEQWGFSATDLLANFTGSLFFIGQHYLWDEQRITIKLSAWPQNYPDQYKHRAEDLYGTSFSELVLKDYNAMTFWLSTSIGSFIKKEHKFPDWINFAFGVGAHNMYGGFDNKWCEADGFGVHNCPEGSLQNANDEYPRMRQFYFSADIDWTKIPTEKKGLKTLFEILNIIKIPFPALEVNTEREVKWHWFQF